MEAAGLVEEVVAAGIAGTAVTDNLEVEVVGMSVDLVDVGQIVVAGIGGVECSSELVVEEAPAVDIWMLDRLE